MNLIIPNEDRNLTPRMAAPSVISIATEGFVCPSLWTRDGISRFSFGIEVEIRPLLERAGLTDLTTIDQLAWSWETLSTSDPNDPTIIWTRFIKRLPIYLNGAIASLAEGDQIGSSGSIRDIVSGRQSTLGYRFNIPEKYAMAMAQVFQEGGCAVSSDEEFKPPTSPQPLPKQDLNLMELIATLNQAAIAAIDLRDQLIIETPQSWGDFGTVFGELARLVFMEASENTPNNAPQVIGEGIDPSNIIEVDAQQRNDD